MNRISISNKLLILLLFYSLHSFTIKISGQDLTIRGRVIDTETKEPLPFVNIIYTERGTGIATNINGYFSIPVTEKLSDLHFSFVGYELLVIPIDTIDFTEQLTVELTKKTIELEEITVYPGVNPAHRIILKALENKNLNNPEKMRSFSYKSYNKLTLTAEKDTSLITANIVNDFDSLNQGHEKFSTDSAKIAQTDSATYRLQNFLARQDLFLMESVSQREFLYPGRNNEVVLASRVSGFQDPSFVLLATQLQSFSFYDELIEIADKSYLNPISRGSTSRYSFILENTILTETNDTVFIISFRPFKNRNFDGLKGVLSINSRGYAIQNVIAEPAETGLRFKIRIHQKYQLIENRQWFPTELNSKIYVSGMRVNNTHIIVGNGRSYLTNIILTPDLHRRKFSHVELSVDPNAHKQTEDFWNRYRAEPLTRKNLKTYHFIDSIGNARRFDRTLMMFQTLISGYIPASIFNIDYASILNFNRQEGIRPGIHFKTNQRLSARFSFGGKFAYGIRDQKFKYGGYGEILLYRPLKLTLGLYHLMDTKEAGAYSFFSPTRTLSNERYRNLVLQNLDYVTDNIASLRFHGLQFLSGEVFVAKSEYLFAGYYRFFHNAQWLQGFSSFETGIRLRYAFNEKFFQSPKGDKISLGTNAPIVYVNFTKGFEDKNSSFSFLRTEARLSKSFSWPKIGTTSLTIEGGTVSGNVPATKLYFGRGSYGAFSIDAENSFGTMRPNEFLNRDFLNIFFRHNFHSLLFKTSKFSPEIIAVTNFGIGRFGDGSMHQGLTFKTMEKAYFESGILFNNLLNQAFFGFGLGVYYRYGAYSFTKTIDNFAFKLTFTVNL